MKRVLITRPEPGATETAARVSALGFAPVVAPVLSIITRQVHAPSHVTATLLTSRNAVAACPSFLHGRPVFAVGTATAVAAANVGFSHVTNADGDAAALAALIAATISPTDGTLFLPTAQRQGGELAAALRKLGFHVMRRVAYQADRVSTLPESAVSRLVRGEIEAAMFFSGETSRHFVHLVRAAGLAETVNEVEAVSISERAAVPLRLLHWRRIRIAAKPNQEAMLVMLT